MRAVAYIRVSTLDQVEGHSLEAQERAFGEFCTTRGWQPFKVYREEGKSAHVEAIASRPVFHQLLSDAALDQFDVVVVHTLDRWSRNQRVMLEALAVLSRHGVGLVSITENIDWSSPHGRFTGQVLGSVAELFSGMLSTHTKKGIGERAHKGLALGSVPFGYERCWKIVDGERQMVCEPEHPGGIHVDAAEGPAVQELFSRYAMGTATLSELAAWANSQGLQTRNTHKGKDGLPDGPRMFTTASVRGILHNPFYLGKVRHGDRLHPGLHEALVSRDVFDAVQDAMRRNSGRSMTLSARPGREYLLKGLVRCAWCRMPMWAQTYNSGRRYYREHRGSRGGGECVNRSGSILCDVPDQQMGKIMSAIVLPDSWMDRVLAQIQAQDEVKRVEEEREHIRLRLKRLGQVYVDGLKPELEYRREKQALEDRLASLKVPGVDAAMEAGRLLENLDRLWADAGLTERRRILMAMLDAVYVDAVEEKAIVAIRAKPAFRPLLEIATTRQGSGVVLITQPPRHVGAEQPCSWWRRGRVELPVQRSPLLGCATGLAGDYSRRPALSPAGACKPASR